MRRIIGIGCLALFVLMPLPVHGRAWPRLMMFHGGALQTERRHITDWMEVRQFFEALESRPVSVPADAPAIEVALYWHAPAWEPYLADPELFKKLPLPPVSSGPLPRPESDDIVGFVQAARLHPPAGNRPALFDYYSAAQYPGLQAIGAKGLDLLFRQKVLAKPPSAQAGQPARH